MYDDMVLQDEILPTEQEQDMQIEGLIAPGAEDVQTIEKLSRMMGESFMEENWTRATLDALGENVSDERKLELSRETMRLEFTYGTTYPACYATPDLAACTGAYLKSDLNGVSWSAVEDEAHAQMARDFMTPEEATAYSEAFKRLEPVSNFDWETGRAKETGYDDFIHFYVIGVDKNARGTGAFRRLIEPFFAYADEHNVPCYLETYSDNLISLYEHVGFKQIKTIEMPGEDLRETLMERLPNQN